MSAASSAIPSFRPSFGANVLAALGGQAACAVVGLATEICYARLLGPAVRGQISLCLMVIAFGVLVGGLGGEVPIVLWAAEARIRTAEWVPGIMLWGLLGSSFAGALWAATYWRWHPRFLHGTTSSLAVIVLATIPAAVLFGYMMAMLAGAERFRLRAGIALADQAAALLAFGALLLYFGGKAEAALLGNLVGILLGAVIILALLHNVFGTAVRVPEATPEFRKKIAIGLRGTFGNIAAFFSYRLDVFIVNFFLGPAEVGLYALGTAVAEALWQVPQAAASALFPRTARALESDAVPFTCLVMRQVLLISCGTGVAIAALSPVAIPLLFGERFAPSVAVIWWLLPGTIALALGKVACADLAARGKTGYTSVFGSVALAVTVALDLVLIPRLGIQGAALASSAAYFTDTILLLIVLRRELGVSWKSFLLPTLNEWVAYQHGWLRLQTFCRGWFTHSIPNAAGVQGDE